MVSEELPLKCVTNETKILTPLNLLFPLNFALHHKSKEQTNISAAKQFLLRIKVY